MSYLLQISLAHLLGYGAVMVWMWKGDHYSSENTLHSQSHKTNSNSPVDTETVRATLPGPPSETLTLPVTVVDGGTVTVNFNFP